MRSEKEMLDLIVNTAREDERIRAVVMNGSRANPNAPHDCFQDFDVVYYVTDVDPFKCNLPWIERFGALMILQMPETMGDPSPDRDEVFVYLMQFTDGNRIDLSICPLDTLSTCGEDSLSVVLLDKDGALASLPPASERGYLPQPPTEKAFADCCNEFWWVSPYVAKGLWREEILYARYYLDHCLREQLMKMITWYVGAKTDFSKSPGKYGKYLKQYLEADLWEALLGTYSDAGYESTWAALYTMGDLFRKLALRVAGRFGFAYPHGDDRRVSAFLEHIHDLPRDAQAIYL